MAVDLCRLLVLLFFLIARISHVSAVEKAIAKKTLEMISELKSMDMSDVMCDECLEEIDCIWPCEVACILDYPVDYAGKICQICLEYFGCTGCKFMCPSPTTPSPSSVPSEFPSTGPTSEPSITPSTGPTVEPTLNPAPQPTGGPTPYPTNGPTIEPSNGPSVEPTAIPSENPTESPSSEPTSFPTTSPSRVPYPGPTFLPTSEPSGEPTALPTPVPSITPSSTPTIPPTQGPTSTPEFWIYYSAYDKELYSFNPIQGGTTYLYNGDFSGDMKVDSVNKFMFWSSPNIGTVTKFDLTNQAIGAILEDYDGVMGLACDPSRGELYFADQNNLAIKIVDYAGTNFSTVHDLAPYYMVPYGMDVSPAATVADFDLNDPGIVIFTAHDDYYGYIVQANLFGGKIEVVYTSTSKALYGIIVDTTYSMMWWLENRGIANGLYCSFFSGSDQSFVAYLENAYWISALWALEMMYTCDYDEGVVYEMDMYVADGTIVATSAIAYVDQPRVIGYYYNLDSDEDLSGDDGSRKTVLSEWHTSGDNQAEISISSGSGGSTSPVAALQASRTYTYADKETLEHNQNSQGDQKSIHAALAIESRDQSHAKNSPYQSSEPEGSLSPKPFELIEEDSAQLSARGNFVGTSWIHLAVGTLVFSIFAAIKYVMRSRHAGFDQIQQNEPL